MVFSTLYHWSVTASRADYTVHATVGREAYLQIFSNDVLCHEGRAQCVSLDYLYDTVEIELIGAGLLCGQLLEIVPSDRCDDMADRAYRTSRADECSPDTSREYFLDLLGRIDSVTER